MKVWTSSSRSKFLFFLLAASIGIASLCDAATVFIKREGLASGIFNDSFALPGGGCDYAGDLVWSHPMSVDRKDRFYVLGSLMLEAAHMTIDLINMWPRCGLSLDGKNYSITLQTFGDESSLEKTIEIGKVLVDTAKKSNPANPANASKSAAFRTDFLLAGYSSGLTSGLSPIADAAGQVLLTAGASQPSVHANMSHVFGLLPPSTSYLATTFQALQSKGARTVAYVQEEGVPNCNGVAEMAVKNGIEFLLGVSVPEFTSPEIFQDVAYNMSKLNPDVMVTCVRTTLDEWNSAMRFVKWSPKAQIYTNVIGTPEFEEAMGTDLPYTMGVSTWDRAVPPIPDAASGLTPYEFDLAFEQFAFRRPAYQQTAQASAISVLAQAIERVGTLQLDRQGLQTAVSDEIANGYFSTVYGNVSFDENGQNKAPALLLQYDGNGTLHVMYPSDLSDTDFEIVYPQPTWEERDCVSKSTCVENNGTCTTDGTCACPAPLLSQGQAATADCVNLEADSSSEDQLKPLLFISLPILLAAIVLTTGLILYQHRNKTLDDSAWKVEKSELVFADPPEVIGRGSFGLVLLAEYRGTKVAVKRGVLTSTSGTKRAHGRSTSFGTDVSEDDEEWGASGKNRASYSGTIPNGRKSIHRSSTFSSKTMSTEDFCKEMRIVSKLRHPCIIGIMGAVVDPTSEPMLVMEYMEHGSLYDILHNSTFILSEEMRVNMLRDITQGCRFLHAATPKVIHGDLKSANILVDSKFNAKVADFGLSQKQSVGATGTLHWMAPELLRGESNNTEASDVYSFGIILYETFSRKDPYEGEDESDVWREVSDPKINRRPPVPKDCPPQLASLMCDCLVSDPDERPSFEEVDIRIKRIETNLAEEAEKNDSVQVSLFDIFPRHIAIALQEGKQVEPEHKDCVTIFFCDIVGYTTISSTLPPRKVANLLDRLYNKFDDLSSKHDVFKVETIGDAYMAVTNLVKDQCDHASRIADFAVDAIIAANSTLIDEEEPDRGCLSIRVGLHSGPIVADVVGNRSPRYCLFGDTVNVASRMESLSIPNRIHCSMQSADLLEEQDCQFQLQSRGEIEVKGRGQMLTFWVTGDWERSVKEGLNRARSSMPLTTESSTKETAPAKNELPTTDVYV